MKHMAPIPWEAPPVPSEALHRIATKASLVKLFVAVLSLTALDCTVKHNRPHSPLMMMNNSLAIPTEGGGVKCMANPCEMPSERASFKLGVIFLAS